MAKAIPEGFHAITPAIVVRNATQAIEFYKKAFGAQELSRMLGPDKKTIAHAELKIGDSIVFLSDEFPGAPCESPQKLGGTSVTLHLYVPDVDSSFKKAVGAGAKENMPVQDMFWGDRYGRVVDPFGHIWGILTHKEDVSPQEMEKRAEAFAKTQQQQRKTA
jgi:PhnB protein